jgi:tetratricopeptide (TPR) repeat protein
MIAVAIVCALVGVARADNKEVAKEAYTEGKRQYDLGEYQAALEAFKKAYLNYEEPVFLFNIAQCYRQLGDTPGAIRSYKAFLRNWPKAPNRAQVERLITELEAQPASPPPPTMPPGPRAPPPTDEAPPPKPAEATASGARPATTIAPKPADAVPAPKSAEATPPAKVEAPPPAKVAEPAGMVEIEPNFERPSGSAKPLKWWAWTLIALGLGGAVAGAVVIAVTQSGGNFKSTLPDFNVSSRALLQVRF